MSGEPAPVTVERVEALLFDVPTIRPHRMAVAVMHHQTICLVRVTCSDGTIGMGECTTIGGLSYGQESPEGMKLAIDTYFTPLLIGQSALPAPAMQRLGANIVGNNFAKCAIETALLDAMGQRCGLPLSELLGGRLRDAVPVLWVLASGDTASDIAEAEDMIERRRHNIFKLKIGRRTLSDDIAHVGAIKRALGDEVSIRVDVNMAWDEVTAARGLALLADVGCDLVEQPIDRSNIAGMARLRRQSRIPIMADEALSGPTSAQAFVAAEAADVFAVKIAQSGGLTPANDVRAIADAAGIALYGGTMLEGPVGTLASAHLFATFPRLAFGTELFGPLLLTEELLAEPLAYEEFGLRVPTAPGLGLLLDDDKVARFRRDAGTPATISAPAGED